MELGTLLVLLLVVMPGLIADELLRFLLWRKNPSAESKTLRALVFSACGLMLMMLLRSAGLGVDLPVYVFEAWWTSEAPTRSIEAVAYSWVTHVWFTLCIALAGAFVLSRQLVARAIAAFTDQSLYDDAWHEFAIKYFKKYALIATKSGPAYYGTLGIISAHGDRSVVVWNPATYSMVDGIEVIEVSGAEAVYIPEDEIASVRVSFAADAIEASASTIGRYNLATGEKL